MLISDCSDLLASLLTYSWRQVITMISSPDVFLRPSAAEGDSGRTRHEQGAFAVCPLRYGCLRLEFHTQVSSHPIQCWDIMSILNARCKPFFFSLFLPPLLACPYLPNRVHVVKSVGPIWCFVQAPTCAYLYLLTYRYVRSYASHRLPGFQRKVGGCMPRALSVRSAFTFLLGAVFPQRAAYTHPPTLQALWASIYLSRYPTHLPPKLPTCRPSR